jgi:hypothetical protein
MDREKTSPSLGNGCPASMLKLKWITPTVWPPFAAPENITLGKMHHVIQVMMVWSDNHLHEFEIAGESYGMSDTDGWGRR